jgi:hypothetical protein
LNLRPTTSPLGFHSATLVHFRENFLVEAKLSRRTEAESLPPIADSSLLRLHCALIA